MDQRPPRERQTEELLTRLGVARRRRRRARLLVATVGCLALLALIVSVSLAAAGAWRPGPHGGSPGGDPSTTLVVSTTGIISTAHGHPTDGTSAGGGSGSTAGVSTTQTKTSVTRRGDVGTTTTTGTAPSTTVPTAPPTPTSVVTTAPPPSGAGKVVVIDPGHQGRGDYDVEPIGPGSNKTKPKVTSGTAGVVTGIPESVLVLTVSLKLRDALSAAGVRVVMTRTSQDVNVSNIQRAQIANQAQANLFVRIHADGSDNPATAGIHVLYPASVPDWTDDIAAESKRAAALAQRELIAATGAKDRGIDARADMTGFNWADVPVILPEIGFMSNPAEDRLLATPSYQDAIVAGLTRAILEFLRQG